MFPASAGMNRHKIQGVTLPHHVPRERGDEPQAHVSASGINAMFPASAGMNRERGRGKGTWRYVPRERGDEPFYSGGGDPISRCSPRARG